MENTLKDIIGKKIQLKNFDEFTMEFDKLANSISQDSKNISVNDTKGLLVKYGFVDLTYEINSGKGFIRIFGKSRTCGMEYFFYNEPDYDDAKTFIKYINNIDSLFPLEFEIIDCCMTNDKDNWEHKYFYM